MPNRVIREGILRSDKVNALSWTAEVFYRRLMSVADDYGRYDGRPSIIRSSLYALRLEKVSESDIVKWMNECSEAELVRFYEVERKPYLEIVDFGQTVRIKKEKFPPCKQMQADASRCMSETKQKPNPETESESESESERAQIFKIDFLKESFNSQFDHSICRDFKISEEKNCAKKEEFFKEIERTEEFLNYKTVQKCKFHYNHWLKKQLEKENKNGFSNRSEQDRRRDERAKLREGFTKMFSNGSNNDTGTNSTIDGEATVIDSNP